MVLPAEYGRRDDLSRSLDSSRDGRIAIERVVRAALVVVDLIRAQRALQVPLPHGDDVVRALAMDAADQSFDIGVLPGRSWR